MKYREYQPSSELLSLQSELDERGRRSSDPLAALMPSLASEISLLGAWQRVSSAQGANTPGLDGRTCSEIEPRLSRFLGELANELNSGSWRAGSARFVDVPKRSGSTQTRRLGILMVKDRVVHAALKHLLEPLIEPMFLESSFGFRPGRSVASALVYATEKLTRLARDGAACEFTVHLDVADCFDSLDHGILMSQLRAIVADEAVLDIIVSILDAGGSVKGPPWSRRKQGVVQGSGLSPLLCNLFLHPVDQILNREVGRRSGLALRYADDLCLAAPSRRELHQLIAIVRRELKQRHLALRDSTARPAPMHMGVDWLGVRIRSRKIPWMRSSVVRFEVPGDRVARMLDHLTEMTALPSERLAGDAFNLSRWIVSLNEQLRQWFEPIAFADNVAEVTRALDSHARERVQELIRHVLGIRNRGMHEFRRRLSRGFWTWEVEGTRLVCLSSLAPKNPDRLIRQPEWQKRRHRPRAYAQYSQSREP